jgi:hypothetical protein
VQILHTNPVKRTSKRTCKVPGKAKASKKKVSLPDSFPEQEQLEWAMTELNFTRKEVENERDKFRDSNEANGRKYSSWPAAWRSWCKSDYCNAGKANLSGRDSNGKPLSSADRANAANLDAFAWAVAEREGRLNG